MCDALSQTAMNAKGVSNHMTSFSSNCGDNHGVWRWVLGSAHDVGVVRAVVHFDRKDCDRPESLQREPGQPITGILPPPATHHCQRVETHDPKSTERSEDLGHRFGN